MVGGKRLRRVATAGLLVLIAGCSHNQAPTSPAHGVSYLLEWKRSKAQASPDGSGWETTNDLGYRIRVSRGYLVTRSLELIPCTAPTPLSLLDSIDGVIGPRPAYAGHSAIPDPSATKHPEVESLVDPQSHYVATLYPGVQRYCQMHYLVARADNSAVGLPSEIDMVDQTLHIAGTFQAADATQPTRFSVTTALANGKLFDLPRDQPAVALDTGSASASVVVRRDLDSLFDHVDFAAMPEKRVGREVLQNLINATEVELRRTHDG